jgi:hypothetical protein
MTPGRPVSVGAAPQLVPGFLLLTRSRPPIRGYEHCRTGFCLSRNPPSEPPGSFRAWLGPRTGETPKRQVRIDDATWRRVEQAAEQDGTTSSAVIRRL